MQPFHDEHFNCQDQTSFAPACDPNFGGQPGAFQNTPAWPSVDNPSLHALPYQHNYQSEKTQRMQLKSHGTKHAIQVETSATKDGWFTVSIESAAKHISNAPNNKAFDWKAKTIFQLTRNELPLFIATMLGMLPFCKFSNHGDQNKWIEIENQNDHFFMKTGGAGLKLHATPVPITEAYLFGCLALRQFVKNFGNMNESAALTVIDRMANQVYGSKQYHKLLEQKGTGRN